MLRLVEGKLENKAAQLTLCRNLISTCERAGIRNIGYPGGNFDRLLYLAKGKIDLWFAYSRPDHSSKIPRYGNAFGVFEANAKAQTISVEINIPANNATEQVAGFFAQDENGAVHLLHSGKIGGGRPGIGKLSFLAYAGQKLVPVIDSEGGVRHGLLICTVTSSHAWQDTRRFIMEVHRFKNAVASGKSFRSAAFKKRMTAIQRYRREFSGKKAYGRGNPVEYVTDHGDVVHKLFLETKARARKGDKVMNSGLIDLCVMRAGKLRAIYEVKTGIGRQALYTSIGQLLTHSVGNKVLKYLVIPEHETLPADIRRAVERFKIAIKQFQLRGQIGKRLVVFKS